jgi:hypothetical protein
MRPPQTPGWRHHPRPRPRAGRWCARTRRALAPAPAGCWAGLCVCHARVHAAGAEWVCVGGCAPGGTGHGTPHAPPRRTLGVVPVHQAVGLEHGIWCDHGLQLLWARQATALLASARQQPPVCVHTGCTPCAARCRDCPATPTLHTTHHTTLSPASLPACLCPQRPRSPHTSCMQRQHRERIAHAACAAHGRNARTLAHALHTRRGVCVQRAVAHIPAHSTAPPCNTPCQATQLLVLAAQERHGAHAASCTRAGGSTRCDCTCGCGESGAPENARGLHCRSLSAGCACVCKGLGLPLCTNEAPCSRFVARHTQDTHTGVTSSFDSPTGHVAHGSTARSHHAWLHSRC